MMENVLFLAMEYPMDLIVAVRVKPAGYHQPYFLIKTEYGHSDVDDIIKCKEMERIEIHELPKELEHIYEWPQIRSHLVCGYRHKIMERIELKE